MCVFMSVYMCVCVVCVHVCVNEYMCVLVSMYMCVCLYRYVFVSVFLCVYVCVCVCMCLRLSDCVQMSKQSRMFLQYSI